MKAYLITLMTVITFSVFTMIYSSLVYVVPVNIPQWQLPGIANTKFVLWLVIILATLFTIMLLQLVSIIKQERKAKES